MRTEEKTKAPEPDGAEKRRYERLPRRLVVTFTYEGEEYTAQSKDLSKGGALFTAPVAPPVGTRFLLNLSDRKRPELEMFLKVTVVRCASGPNGEPLFGVEFGDVVSRDPTRVRLFLERVLGVDSGLIRIEEGTGEKAYVFSFNPIHQEGQERLRALQSSLFQSVEEMEEADAILSNFGKVPSAEELEAGAAMAPSDVKITRVQETPQPVQAQAVPAPAPAEPVPEPRNQRTTASWPAVSLPPSTDQPADQEELPLEAIADLPEPPPEPLPAPLPKPEKKPRLSFFSSLFGPKPKKGETLIRTQPVPTVVAGNLDIPVVYRLGTSRFQGVATRLYCAGLKCRTEQQLPALYASVLIVIPLAGARKISQIEVQGDVTRVRPEQAGADQGGIFEVRLSMRTDKMHLELYRALLERLTGQPG